VVVVVVLEVAVEDLVAGTSEAEAGCAEVERAWPDLVLAVVVRVITIAEGWVSLIRAGHSRGLRFIDRPRLRDRIAGRPIQWHTNPEQAGPIQWRVNPEQAGCPR
jgi:hypothetical protein